MEGGQSEVARGIRALDPAIVNCSSAPAGGIEAVTSQTESIVNLIFLWFEGKLFG